MQSVLVTHAPSTTRADRLQPLRVLLGGFLTISLLVMHSVKAAEPDWSAYQEVLAHVKPGSKHGVELMLVDYPAVKQNGSLERAYQALTGFDQRQLSGRNEQLAFYINAYNILALKTVADHWPLDSIKDVGSLLSPVWDKSAGDIGGKTVTLGEVEHKILRPMGEPRMHMAIVCASVSCPDLRAEPYTAAHLSKQLDEQTQQFLRNTGKGLAVEGDRIQASKIFDWFEDDFAGHGGIKGFIRHYRPELADLPIKTSIDYDWSVNSSR